MPKGEHWEGKRRKWPVRHCAQCNEIIKPRKFLHTRGSGKATTEWYLPKKYCSLQCTGMAAHERQLSKARGRFVDKFGYVLLTNRKGDNGYQQPEHRAVMEEMLGRKLLKHETVHHKNGIRHDNRPENLELWAGRHGRGQRVEDLAAEEDIWSGMIPSYQINARL